MKIAVASGKGGTGKTAVAVSLAAVASTKSCCLIDCDVEAPNAAHFLRKDITETKTATVPIPKIDYNFCNFCGACGQICQFNAIAVLLKEVIVLDKLCHSCGACSIACPVPGALTEVPKEIGLIRVGNSNFGNIKVIDGLLNIGEPIATQLINQVKETNQNSDVTIIDCPPGAACPVIESIKGSDYVILVTEPTPFGAHDLSLALELTSVLRIPRAVVINKDDPNTDQEEIESLCRKNNAPIVLRIPFKREFAQKYAVGELFIYQDLELRSDMLTMLENIESEIQKAKGVVD